MRVTTATVATTVTAMACLLVAGCGGTREPVGEASASTSAPTQGPRLPAGPRATDSADPGATRPAGVQKGTGDWRIRQPAEGRIEAFTAVSSGPPGTRVGVKVSTSAGSYRVTAYRIGAYKGGWGSQVWQSEPLRGRLQPEAVFAPAETRTVVAPWSEDLTIDTTGWMPGYHVIKLRTGTGFETQVPYVVSSPSAAGTVALVAPITTWQAYNQWGGYSLYHGPDGDRRSWAVSFDRPYQGAVGANDYRLAALPIVLRAEQLGIPLSYFTNVDLDQRPELLAGARGYASLGHDEYWTTGMRRAVTRARDAGTNLAFFGANTMYWRIRLEDRDTGPARLVVGYRDDAHVDPLREERPADATSRFRDAPVPRPEHELIGMQYECFPVDADYVVVSPRWWGFAGTGVGYGDRLEGLVGPEADRVYPDRLLPHPLQVLAHTPYDCRGVATTAQSVYYTTPSGAGVFTAGTLRWGCAMIDGCDRPIDDRVGRFVSTVTGTVLKEFAAGPVGERHPARENLDDFDLPLVNSVSAS